MGGGMDLQTAALYGDYAAPTMGADMLNSAQSANEVDWGAVLANGIRGAAQGAIAASVGGAYADGQLQAATVQKQRNMNMLLLVGVGAYLMMGQ